MNDKQVFCLWDRPPYRAILKFDTHRQAMQTVRGMDDPGLFKIKAKAAKQLLRKHRVTSLPITDVELSIGKCLLFPISTQAPIYPVTVKVDGLRYVMVFDNRIAAEKIAKRYHGNRTDIPTIDSRFKQTSVDEYQCYAAAL